MVSPQQSRVPDTSAERCHCGRDMEGSDHCPFCGCEIFERYCNAHYASGKPPTKSWVPFHWDEKYVTH
jgi:hypothetical protein